MTLTPQEWEWLRNLVLMRCDARCEVSGDPLQPGRWSLHHRRPRGMGGSKDPGTNTLANLLAVTGDGTRGVHGWIESHREAAVTHGWIVRQGQDPAATPITLYSGRRVLLDPLAPTYTPTGEWLENPVIEAGRIGPL